MTAVRAADSIEFFCSLVAHLNKKDEMAVNSGMFVELEGRIVAKAVRDDSYRQALLEDPKSVLQKELETFEPNARLDAGIRVEVIEQSEDVIQIVLPPSRKSNEAESAEGRPSSYVSVTFVTNVCGCVG